MEDWYADGMQSFDPVMQTGDRRFYYIKKHIRREYVAEDWTIVPLRPLEAGTLHVKPAYPDMIAGYLLPILEKPLRANDHAGIAARLKNLEEFFQGFSPESARELTLRLDAPRTNDTLAQAFHYRLSTPTRHRLLHILRTKWARTMSGKS